MRRKEYTFDPFAPAVRQAKLASYVLARLPEFKQIMRDAEPYLTLQTHRRSFSGYGDPAMVEDQVIALYLTLGKRGFKLLDGQPDVNGAEQVVRLADELLIEKYGCCMDFVLLMAGVLMFVGLEPLIVVVQKGRDPRAHALLGYWRTRRLQESEALRPEVLTDADVNRLQTQIHFLDCTCWTDPPVDPSWSDVRAYWDAVQKANAHVAFDPDGWHVLYAVDVKACRNTGRRACDTEFRFIPYQWFRHPAIRRAVQLGAASLAVLMLSGAELIARPALKGNELPRFVKALVAPLARRPIWPGTIPPRINPGRAFVRNGVAPPPIASTELAGVFVHVPAEPAHVRMLAQKLVRDLAARQVPLANSASRALTVINVGTTEPEYEDRSAGRITASVTASLEWSTKRSPAAETRSGFEHFSCRSTNLTRTSALVMGLDDVAERMATHVAARVVTQP